MAYTWNTSRALNMGVIEPSGVMCGQGSLKIHHVSVIQGEEDGAVEGVGRRGYREGRWWAGLPPVPQARKWLMVEASS